MIVLQEKTDGYHNVMEKFHLNEAYMNSENVFIGTLICFLITKEQDVIFYHLFTNGIGEKDGFYLSNNCVDKELLSDIHTFCHKFKETGSFNWHLSCLIHGVLVEFFGHCYGTFVGVNMPEGSTLDVTEILKNVEQKTHLFK